jgi:cytochrome b561/polyisoprenoid-binding protein YceI
MPLFSTPDKFGFIHKTLHWVMGILIIMNLMIGYRMGMMEPSPDKIYVVYFHKSWGILILMLACLRLIVRLGTRRPDPEPTLKKWEIDLSRIVHFLLYVAFFAMPLSGWIMSSGGKYPVPFFGLFNMPDIVPRSAGLSGAARQVHDTLAVVILGLLFLHFSGAAKHHVIDRDNTLRHMTWDRMNYVMGIVLLGILGAFYLVPVYLKFVAPEYEPSPQAVHQEAQASPVTQVPQTESSQWIVDGSVSTIKFTATQSGAPFDGEFKNFTAVIVFDPETVTGHVDVGIPINQMTTGSERDAEIGKPDWFDVENFPMARFKAESFEKIAANQYVAHGTLTIRGVAKALDLPFTLDIQEGAPKQVEMKAEITLNRLDFGIGQGEWQKTDMIADAVTISIYVKASLASP